MNLRVRRVTGVSAIVAVVCVVERDGEVEAGGIVEVAVGGLEMIETILGFVSLCSVGSRLVAASRLGLART